MTSSFVYHDVGALHSIKLQARQDELGALHTVAQQFESMLLEQMLKTSRDTLELINPDGLMSGHSASTWQEMHDQQLALTLSSQGGLGLADALVDQWAAQLKLGGKELPDEVVDLPQQMRPQVQRAPMIQARVRPESVVNAAPMQSPTPTVAAALDTEPMVDQPDMPAHVLNFVAKLWPDAQQVAEELGLDPRFLLAQAALETGWGRHMIRTQEGSDSHNLFGIKSHRDWQGPSATVTTHEYRQGVRLQQQDGFRVYDNYQHSMQDYVAFLRSNPRYQQALAQTDNGADYAHALQQAGYATDPRYAQKIISLAEGRHLNAAIARMQEVS